MIASKEVKDSLLMAIATGKTKLLEFIDERLDAKIDAVDISTDKAKKNFHESIKQNKLKTFDDLQKKTQVKINGKVVKKFILPELVYQRALSVS